MILVDIDKYVYDKKITHAIASSIEVRYRNTHLISVLCCFEVYMKILRIYLWLKDLSQL